MMMPSRSWRKEDVARRVFRLIFLRGGEGRLMVVGITQRMRGRGEGEETNIHRKNHTIIQMGETINSDDLNMRVIQVQANLFH